jgi:hypothetical protein
LPHLAPVTITAPAQEPFSSNFPTHIAVATGAAHTETFTVSNPLSFAVEYMFQGPCIHPAGSLSSCRKPRPTVLYDWTSTVVVGANSSATFVIEASGTTDLMEPGAGNDPLAPGTYQFQGLGGRPLTLTVTP